jgi:L-gulono-1,4-lactone dehydrogenase
VSALYLPGGRWRNWGGSERAKPAHLVRARGVDDVIDVVRNAEAQQLRVKAIGAGHSFSGIAVPEGVQLDVSAIDGVLAVEGNLVTLGAGTNLYQLPALLRPHGLALANMGDIDRQTIAGATSTGTHGTGLRFGGLATQVRALTLVTGSGELLHISETENAEMLPAARLGLGALGILVDVTIECVPEFLLHAVEKPEPLEQVLDGWVERVQAADHFEFYWFPHTDAALTKTNTRLSGDAERHPQPRFAKWFDDEFMSNGLYAVTQGITYGIPALIPAQNRMAVHGVAEREVTDRSYAVFTAPRRVRFREMEYAIPLADVPDALRAVRELIETRGWRIGFPVEVRAAAADDNWLSTAHGRESGYIAVHRYHRDDPTEYFAAVEAIMRDFDGRPHWGKMNSRTADDLRPSYSRFGDFVAVRDRLDPERRFANAYLERVLGP